MPDGGGNADIMKRSYHWSRTRHARLALIGALAIPGVAGIPALRSQEVVQALPPREAGQLNAALRALSARPNDLEALITAGNASLVLSDINAAAGFFARAVRVAPSDARVLLGSARVALAQRRPIEALAGFAQAETAGAPALDMAADRALAYDLVGDNSAAQALYRSALAADDTSEVRTRLALSYAIAGNRQEFERTLYPLLRKEDRSAFRTRAFGLAILGQPDDAVEIADAMMPTDLALRMAPYLRYMPRLTRSQQAAAANLGAFPAATEIGRDSPDIGSYARAGARIAANANASMTPAGAPLGQRAQQPSSVPPPAQRRPGGQSAPLTAPTRVATATPVAASAQASTASGSANASPAPGRVAQATPAPVRVAVAPAVPGSVDRSRGPATLTPAAPPSSVAMVRPSPAPAPTPARVSLADTFADLGGPRVVTAAAAGAVDISRIQPTRPPAPASPPPPPKPKPEVRKPAEPSRIWVQVGVGRNTGAFAFDWRRLARQADGALDGKGPWAVKYGATNRMLAGPFPSQAAAREAIKRLKAKDIDSLPFTSDAGETVTKIG